MSDSGFYDFFRGRVAFSGMTLLSVGLAFGLSISFAFSQKNETLPTRNNQKADGYKGIWFTLHGQAYSPGDLCPEGEQNLLRVRRYHRGTGSLFAVHDREL